MWYILDTYMVDYPTNVEIEPFLRIGTYFGVGSFQN